MSAKRIFYFNVIPHPAFAEVMGERRDVTLTKLDRSTPEAEAATVLASAHAYQISSAKSDLAPDFHATAALLARAPDLLLVSTSGVGYDTVDLDACTAAGVLACNQAGGNAESVAEHVLAMLLSLSKRIVESDRRMRSGPGIRRIEYMNGEAFGKTIGIVGIGNVGRRVAAMCGGMLNMRVLAYDPYLSAAEIAARGAEKVELDELVRQADFVSVSCPLTQESRGMIGARQYAAMQKHAYFITTARGFIHDEDALLEALRAKKIAGAGLDVWSKEPPPPDHPLLQFDNVLASPHTAGVTREARENMGRIAAEQLLDALDGRRPPRIINPEVWPRYQERFARTFGITPR